MGNVLLNSNNPTGALYPVDLLREILEIARQHQLIAYASEIIRQGAVRRRPAHLDHFPGGRCVVRDLLRCDDRRQPGYERAKRSASTALVSRCRLGAVES